MDLPHTAPDVKRLFRSGSGTLLLLQFAIPCSYSALLCGARAQDSGTPSQAVPPPGPQPPAPTQPRQEQQTCAGKAAGQHRVTTAPQALQWITSAGKSPA